MSKEEDNEKAALDEILRVMDQWFADICGKLETIEILLFIIALPTIMALIFLLLVFTGAIALPWRFP